MLTSMQLKKFTVFSDEKLEFASGLNVVVGENSSGKSQLLKLAYSLIATSAEMGRNPDAPAPTKSYLGIRYTEKLIGVFRPESLGRLVTRTQGRNRCEVALTFEDEDLNTAVSFGTGAKTGVQIKKHPSRWDTQRPLYLPTRELLTIYPGFVSLYESRYLAFEETWYDTCVHLGVLALKGAREKSVAALIEPIEQALKGKVVLDENGRFYLKIPGSGNMEMSLVAEGLRKLAMLACLIANGVIQQQGYLFWDEPEANLNPRLIKLVAEVIYKLSLGGVQVFIATHSLFLLRELEILMASSKSKPSARFFGLHVSDQGVSVEQGDSIYDIGDITALDESLLQSDRYLAMGR